MNISNMTEAQKQERLKELKKLIEKGVLLDNLSDAIDFFQIDEGVTEKQAKKIVKDLLAIDKEAIM